MREEQPIVRPRLLDWKVIEPPLGEKRFCEAGRHSIQWSVVWIRFKSCKVANQRGLWTSDGHHQGRSARAVALPAAPSTNPERLAGKSVISRLERWGGSVHIFALDKSSPSDMLATNQPRESR